MRFEKLLTLVLLCFLCAVNTFAQQKQSFDSRIIYRLSYFLDSMDREKPKVEFTELLLRDSLAVFRSVNKGRNDSIDFFFAQKLAEFQGQSGEISYPRILPSGLTFMIFQRNSRISYTELLLDKSYYTYNEPAVIDWELTEEVAKINGYDCQKAICSIGNRRWIAWFDPTIPIHYGPYKFSGLPGLIVQVSDETQSWSFELAGIQHHVVDVYFPAGEKINQAKTVEKANFYKTKKYLIDNYFELSAATRFANDKDGTQKLAAKRNYLAKVAKENNWIELYL